MHRDEDPARIYPGADQQLSRSLADAARRFDGVDDQVKDHLAWSILERGVDGFLSVSDESVAETMKLLADAPFRDIPVVAGESAVAGLTGLLLAARDDDVRRQVQLDENSIILLIGTEGATDPSVYESLVDRNPDEVSRAAKLASTARRVS